MKYIHENNRCISQRRSSWRLSQQDPLGRHNQSRGAIVSSFETHVITDFATELANSARRQSDLLRFAPPAARLQQIVRWFKRRVRDCFNSAGATRVVFPDPGGACTIEIGEHCTLRTIWSTAASMGVASSEVNRFFSIEWMAHGSSPEQVSGPRLLLVDVRVAGEDVLCWHGLPSNHQIRPLFRPRVCRYSWRLRSLQTHRPTPAARAKSRNQTAARGSLRCPGFASLDRGLESPCQSQSSQ